MIRLDHPQTGNAVPLTSAPVQCPTQTSVVASRPEWIRLPKPSTLCPWTGLSRSKLWEVLQRGRVRNICLRKDGAVRGARLIHLKGLLDYLDSLASEPPAHAGKEGCDDAE